ncbi:MAG: methyltransferase [Flavobacteriaceae bacterium]|nr:methyltransferase [Flavobacteriaceae bacterium]|tara:strand:- start:331014 stop:331871 length:858 start_codon:yes stop_codon:yes gene_type:complete
MKDLKRQKPFVSCKDYLVSSEQFELFKDEDFDLLYTYPVPKNLASYYESENYISHTDQKKSLFDRVYQAAKKTALQRKLRLLNSLNLEEKKVLDIGAGTGDFLKVCQEDGWQVSGTEPNSKARSLAASKGLELLEETSALSGLQFDVITMWHVLEHIEHLQTFIEELKGMLKPNGYLIVAVPNFKSYDANFYKEYWAAYDVPRHLWHFSQKSIKQLFLKKNIGLKKVLPMKFDAYYVSLLSEKYRSGKMRPLQAFYRGWLSNWKAKQSGEYSSLIYVLKNGVEPI